MFAQGYLRYVLKSAFMKRCLACLLIIHFAFRHLVLCLHPSSSRLVSILAKMMKDSAVMARDGIELCSVGVAAL